LIQKKKKKKVDDPINEKEVGSLTLDPNKLKQCRNNYKG